MRQIILDTETTGIGPEKGHRIIEIGCVELIERKLTGNHFHFYFNPQRPVDSEAFRIHGISDEFLQDKPLFAEKAKDFLNFIDGAELIIHNAPFDVGFLNHELKFDKKNKKIEDYCNIIDTLVLAREKYPGQRNSLDALCKRYGIEHFNRQLHGALLDAEILALVYLAMTGGQTHLFREDEETSIQVNYKQRESADLNLIHPLVILAESEELQAHNSFIDFICKRSGINFWKEN